MMNKRSSTFYLVALMLTRQLGESLEEYRTVTSVNIAEKLVIKMSERRV